MKQIKTSISVTDFKDMDLARSFYNENRSEYIRKAVEERLNKDYSHFRKIYGSRYREMLEKVHQRKENV